MKIPVSLLLCATVACFSALHDTASASGVCSMSGGGHYYTFDGTKFNYQGVCRLNFASDCKGVGNFNITFNNEVRSGYDNVSFVGYITVVLGSVQAIIGHYPSSSYPLSVWVDGTQVTSFPKSTSDYSINKVTQACDDYIVLNASTYNFQIHYNEWGVILIVDDSYKTKMCGVCGNFNDNSADDLIDGPFDANTHSPNVGKAWGDYNVVTATCLATNPTHDDVPTCTDNSYACSAVCDFLVDSSNSINAIFSSAAQAMGSTLAQYYKTDCQIDACLSSGQSLRNSVRQFVNYARFKYPSCTGCQTTIGGFPLSYSRVSCNDARCDCSSSLCRLHIPLCGYWCDCVGLSSGYGTLYECWDGTISNRCFLFADSMADTCSASSGTTGNSANPFLPSL